MISPLLSKKFSNYPAAYEHELDNFVPRNILEIGVASGGTLHNLKLRYPWAQIVGVDIDPRCQRAAVPEADIRVYIGNQANRDFLDFVEGMSGPAPFDLIIDDGCHRGPWQKETFKHLWPRLASPGIYVIEDLHTHFAPLWRFGNWGGSFLNFLRRRLILWQQKGVCDFYRISLYQSICFIHKQKHPRQEELITGHLNIQT